MTSKIKIKVGQVEIEFEGSEEFLAKELPVLLKNVSSLTAIVPHVTIGAEGGNNPPPPLGEHIQLTTNSIAAKLSVKKGGDLVIAAAAHLTLVKNAQTFTRQQILKEMQTAKSYYRKNYSANLTTYLNTITDSGTLIESAANAYALSAADKTDLEKKLAN